MTNKSLVQHITEETLHAWLDNELGQRQSTVVGEHVQRCHECRELLDECREMRDTVSQLLLSFDGELRREPLAPDRTERRGSARMPVVPIISHIVAFNQPVQFWPTARRMVSMAALAVIFVGTASIVMARGYHAVSGSVNTFANRGSGVTSGRTQGAESKPTFDHRVNVNGKVTTTGGRGVSGARVSIRGTSMKTVTDFAGYFWFRGVPQSATAIEAKGALGYEAHVKYVNLYDASEPIVNIVLRSSVLSLTPYVVTTESPPWDAPKSQACLKSFEAYGARNPRLFQELRGEIPGPGNFRLEVIDWPVPGKNSLALFTLQANGALVGQVQNGGAEMRMNLSRFGSVWRGLASETRNNRKKIERSVSLIESNCSPASSK